MRDMSVACEEDDIFSQQPRVSLCKSSISLRSSVDSSSALRTGRRQSIDVVLTCAINGRYAFAKPLLVGTFKTSRTLLLHDVAIREGSPFDVRKVEEARERLLSRAYVTSVDVSSPAVALDARSPPTPAAVRQPFPSSTR